MAPKFFGRPAINAPNGEKAVFQALKYLPDECVIFYEPILRSNKNGNRRPDFVVVHPEWGVTVLEVKGWQNEHVRQASSEKVQLVTGKQETSPVHQALTASHVLNEMLEARPELLHYAGYYQGKLTFPYRHAGVAPYINGKVLRKLKEIWGESYLLGEPDLKKNRIAKSLANIYSPFQARMTPKQVSVVCNLLDPNRFREIRTPDNGQLKGIYDPDQVDIATADLDNQTQPEESESATLQLPGFTQIMTDEAREVARPQAHVRLVRGLAGTGKTDVLILRTHYLKDKHPDLDILVTTFNKPLYEQRLGPELKNLDGVTVRRFMQLCADIYMTKHAWQKPQRTIGLIERLNNEYAFPLAKRVGVQFIADEIEWMKEAQRTDRQEYIKSVREGRGSGSEGRRLSRFMKEQMFYIFMRYQEHLDQMGAIDWADLPNYALQILKEGVEPPRKYDAILIDEAQHLAPTWIEILKYYMKPGGQFFLCEDPSQSVYRFYSWKQKGLNVRGRRTRWLRVPYRNTRQIFEAAYALIKKNRLAHSLLSESGESLPPNLDHEAIRDGERPQLRRFLSWRDERDFIVQEVNTLIDQGIYPHQIGILHSDANIIKRYEDKLGVKGIKLYETRRQTGLEYTVVFVPNIDAMYSKLPDEEEEEALARRQLEFYMTMTRAREQLYLSFVDNWPEPLEPILPYVDEISMPTRL